MRKNYSSIFQRKKLITYFKIIIFLVFSFSIAILVGLKNTKIVDFYPSNNGFQDYNVVRRLLAGQTPFKDFAVYLGLGHLYLLSFFQLIIGNSFGLSIFNTNMVTMLIFELFVFEISYLILNNKTQSAYLTIIISLLNLIRPKILEKVFALQIISSFNLGITVGTSARLIRNASCVIFPIIIVILFKLIDKLKNINKIKNAFLTKKIIYPLIAGICILWSNDGGISTYIVLSFVYFLLLIKEYNKNLKSIFLFTLLYIILSLTSFSIVLLIATKGNIIAWFNYTLGVSSYQSWYYGEAIDKVNISLKNLDFSFPIYLIILYVIFLIVKIFKSQNNNQTLNFSMLTVIILSSFTSSFLYQWLSGGYNKDILHLVFLIAIINIIVKIILNLIKHYKNRWTFYVSRIFPIIFFAISGGVLINGYLNSIKEIKLYRKEINYNKDLDGYLEYLNDDLNYIKPKIMDNSIFSTYAGPLETINNTFQPSGYDYIIHVLGDKNREKYLETFNKGNFKYVVTTDNDVRSYRYWIKNANWFFYKELYKNYKPIIKDEYQMFWQKDVKENINIKANLNIERINESQINLTVYTEDLNFNGIASIKIGYNAVFNKNIFKSLVVRKYVYVDDITGKEVTSIPFVNYNIPIEAQEYYIPITIVDGVGKVSINSYPFPDTNLEIYYAEIDDIFDTNFKYGSFSNLKNDNNSILYAVDTKENEIIFEDAKYLQNGNIKTKVVNKFIEDGFIGIEIENNKKYFTYPNMFEIIK